MDKVDNNISTIKNSIKTIKAIIPTQSVIIPPLISALLFIIFIIEIQYKIVNKKPLTKPNLLM